MSFISRPVLIFSSFGFRPSLGDLFRESLPLSQRFTLVERIGFMATAKLLFAYEIIISIENGTYTYIKIRLKIYHYVK